MAKHGIQNWNRLKLTLWNLMINFIKAGVNNPARNNQDLNSCEILNFALISWSVNFP